MQIYICEKHGHQQMIGMAMRITQNGKTVDRDYCMECWIEMMDRNCCQLLPDGKSNNTHAGFLLEMKVNQNEG